MNTSSYVVRVYYMKGFNKIFVGRLASENRQILFEYDQSFLKTGLSLSPFKLPLKAGVLACDDQVFGGLFGVFNDSLPDGWGRLLLDRKLMTLGLNPDALTPLDRLCYVGSTGMGALCYEPEMQDTAAQVHQNLDEISDECLRFQTTDEDAFVDELLLMNGSSAGARPKIWVGLDNGSSLVKHVTNDHFEDNLWMIKFSSSMDPKDMGSVEYAYHLMAEAAGLDVPEARLFPSKKCSGYFGVKRFDRNASGFLHMHSMSGLLHADHRTPSLDYKMLMQATLRLTQDQRESEKQFRQAVFNVLSHNRDDHAKNFSFLMDSDGVWRVSPAYDLTFSSGPSGEHCTMIMGEGKHPSHAHFLKLADIGDIKKQRALMIIDEVSAAISQWSNFAKMANVTSTSLKRIQSAFERVKHYF
jgi:serine/threonine-protein kinase HipA